MVKVLLVGAGAREHALAWKLRQSPRLEALFVAPGNAGTATLATNLPIAATDIEGIVRAAREHRIDLVIVGPEDPLALGLVDRLAVEGIAAFGPSRRAAQIEASKAFAKEVMTAAGIPTAPYRVFDDPEAAEQHVRSLSGPVVVKADGLAGGKGAVVASSCEEAVDAIQAMMVRRIFGDAGRRVVIEERLQGREVSAHAFTDGVTVVPMPLSRDHKAVYDNDQGPNTGGMGVCSPPDFVSTEMACWIDTTITEPAVKAMFAMGRPYRGVLYPGLMITAEGPKVLEFNCRFGDPETQALLPRLKTDLFEVLWAVAHNRLGEVKVEWSDEAAVGVVLASGGYPGEYKSGFPIEGLADVDPDVLVFHAGTKAVEGGIVTAGGRVLTVVATGRTLAEARTKVYANVEHIRFEGMHYRRDIALREVQADL